MADKNGHSQRSFLKYMQVVDTSLIKLSNFYKEYQSKMNFFQGVLIIILVLYMPLYF